MELYFSPFACSLAAHMLCKELQLDVHLRRVELRSKRLEDGSSFLDIAPKGQVPTLVLDDGSVLTENIAVLSYLADLQPDKQLSPPDATPERYQMLEWLSFVSAELHKRVYYMIFWCDEHHANAAREAAPAKLQIAEDHLRTREFLVGERFTAADAYLSWWLLLAPMAKVDLDAFPGLRDYAQRCADREGAGAAVAYEQALMSNS